MTAKDSPLCNPQHENSASLARRFKLERDRLQKAMDAILEIAVHADSNDHTAADLAFHRIIELSGMAPTPTGPPKCPTCGRMY